MTKKDNTPHLLLVRFSAMGDVAMIAPVVQALRKAHPELKISLLTRPFFRTFFRDVEGLGFVDLDLGGRHKGMAGMIRLRNDINAVGVTHVADLHDVLRTKLLRRLLSGTTRKIAVIDKGREQKRELTRKFRKELRQLETSVARYADTIRRLGFDFPDPVPAVKSPRPVPAEIICAAGEKQGVWIGVAPFAQHKGKIYPTDLTDKLIGLLSERYDRVFIFGGGPYEREFAEHMESRYPRVHSVIGKIKLGGELDLMSNLDAIVTMDSSAMHMASLEGTPVVSVWGATHPYAGFYGFGQDPANAVQLQMHCRPCSVYGNKPCLYKDYPCLTGIAPETIADKVETVVRGRQTPKG